MCQSESSQEKRNHSNCFNKDNLMWGVGQMGNGRDIDKTDTNFRKQLHFQSYRNKGKRLGFSRNLDTWSKGPQNCLPGGYLYKGPDKRLDPRGGKNLKTGTTCFWNQPCYLGKEPSYQGDPQSSRKQKGNGEFFLSPPAFWLPSNFSYW